MILLVILLDRRIGVDFQEVRIVADEAFRVDVARQRLVFAFFNGFYIKGTDARAFLNVFDR